MVRISDLIYFSLKILYFCVFKNYITKIHKCSQFIESKTEFAPPIAVPLQIFLILVDDATTQPLGQAINLWVITLSLSFPTSLHHSAFHLIDSINLVDSTSFSFLLWLGFKNLTTLIFFNFMLAKHTLEKAFLQQALV